MDFSPFEAGGQVYLVIFGFLNDQRIEILNLFELFSKSYSFQRALALALVFCSGIRSNFGDEHSFCWVMIEFPFGMGERLGFVVS